MVHLVSKMCVSNGDEILSSLEISQGDQMRAEMPMSGIFEGLLAEKKDVGQWAESRAFSRKC